MDSIVFKGVVIMFRKALMTFICFTLISTSLFLKPQKVEAFVGIDDLTILGVAALFTAAGVTFANSSSVRAVATDFISHLSQSAQSMYTMTKNAITGVIAPLTVVPEMTNDIKNYLDNVINGYTNGKSLPYYITQTYSNGLTYNTNSNLSIPINTGIMKFNVTPNSGSSTTALINSRVLELDFSGSNMAVNISGSVNANIPFTPTTDQFEIDINSLDSTTNKINILINGIQKYTWEYNQYLYFQYVWGGTFTNLTWWDGSTVNNITNNYIYNINDVPVNRNQYIDNPNFDLNYKTVGVPSGVTTPETIVNTPTANIPVSDVASTTTNTLLSQILARQATIAGTVDQLVGCNTPNSICTANAPSDPSFDPTNLFAMFFDFFRAILAYLIRLLTFLLTLPTISSIPLSSPGFDYFLNYTIGGTGSGNGGFVQFTNTMPINLSLRTIIQWMLTLALSLSVYKVLKRFF